MPTSPEQVIIALALVVTVLLLALMLLCYFCNCGSAMREYANEYNSMYIIEDDDDDEGDTKGEKQEQEGDTSNERAKKNL
jgi:hypothetical protein